MTKFKKLIAGFKKRFDKKSSSIFISNSTECACNYYLNLSKKINHGKVFHITDIRKFQLDDIKTNNPIFIFAHGDLIKLKCYYIDGNKKKEISDEWWKRMQRSNGIIYFHVCYGSEIILNSNVLLNKFDKWVSYNEKVVYYRTDDIPELDKIYEDIFNLTYDASVTSKNSLEFMNRITTINESMRDRIFEIPDIGNILITSIGANMEALTCSKVS